jgi:hypothetical protein
VTRLRDVALGVLTVRILDRIGAPRRRRGAAVAAPAAPRATASRAPRRSLLLLTLGALAVGAVLMILFEHTITRVVGVTALFTFVIAGVFLIADPGWLAEGDDDQSPLAPRGRLR